MHLSFQSFRDDLLRSYTDCSQRPFMDGSVFPNCGLTSPFGERLPEPFVCLSVIVSLSLSVCHWSLCPCLSVCLSLSRFRAPAPAPPSGKTDPSIKGRCEPPVYDLCKSSTNDLKDTISCLSPLHPLSFPLSGLASPPCAYTRVTSLSRHLSQGPSLSLVCFELSHFSLGTFPKGRWAN
jgi:hypothetical protein